MFGTSTQKKYWIFAGDEILKKIREETNTNYIQRSLANGSVTNTQLFLTVDEERIIVSYFEQHLRDFCNRFNPPMPKTVVATSFHYFKRFYLYNSVMDYHPKEILVTCVYLACKIDEFNVSIEQFVANIKGDRVKATDIILSNELMLMCALRFHLTIHAPYRAVEGFIIDLKTRWSKFDVEILRPNIDEFLDRVLLTDALLLYTPSQIALAGVLQAASKKGHNLDDYVTDMLITEPNKTEKLKAVIDAIRAIRLMVRAKLTEVIAPDVVKSLSRKLEHCRNQENNPAKVKKEDGDSSSMGMGMT